MIPPVQRDAELLADIRSGAGSGFGLWWLGQSGFVLRWQDRCLVVDPYLSDSLTRKYAGTDLEHVRMTERCLDPAGLGFVDVAVSSHAHTDHLDADTLVPLEQSTRFQLKAAEVGREVKLTIRAGQKHGWRTMIWDAHLFAGWMTEQLDAKIVRGDR